MSNNGHGQAKILKPDEIKLLLERGLISARDQAIFMFCLYTACRISEARQMPWGNVFNKGTVLEEIVIPKEITKGKQATRTIPTHPSLAKFLEKYHQESLALVKLRELTGDWSCWSMTKAGKIPVNQYLGCPNCASTRLIKYGFEKGKQNYRCKNCKLKFGESIAIKNEAAHEMPVVLYDSLGVTSSKNYGFLFLNPDNSFLFPGKRSKGCLSLSGAESIFRAAFAKAGIFGASSHSCRRTALTTMHSAGVPLRVLQEISGHRDLGALQRYLEVSEEEVSGAINLLG